ncbi:MAG: DUF2269 domain-containing protein [Anaerolineae bacterium]|nr:DUF2269 domain-containing protein [Anaerolineae bacterium]
MVLSSSLRKFILTVHITVSVGWIGALMAYIGLVIAALNSQEAKIIRASWLAMELLARSILTPFALGSLLTGLVLSLGTKWGLFRHYWVLISLLLTLISTIILLTQLGNIRFFAEIAASTNNSNTRDGLWGQLLHAGGGLVTLLIVQVLNVYKPRGLTPYGWRKQQEQRTVAPTIEDAVI